MSRDLTKDSKFFPMPIGTEGLKGERADPTKVRCSRRSQIAVPS